MTCTVLLVDDDDSILSLLNTYVKNMGFETQTAITAEATRQKFQEYDFDLALIDYKLPDGDGLQLLHEIHQINPDLPVIMITASGTVNLAVEAMRAGAYDFCPKPIDLNRIKVSVKNAIEQYQLKKQVHSYQRTHKNKLAGMIGSSPRMQVMYHMIEMVAPTNAPVLITGESGTGKELVAQAIHRLSSRRDKELVDLNCAAIPKELLENELFGHEPHSFTGAKERYTGRCERADCSTLFLDEIAEMDVGLQAKMLRFLQDFCFYRIGGKERIKVDARIIAATNKDPLAAIEQGEFREDLYYRLNVVNIITPPLRERAEDIPELAEFFLMKYAKEMERPCKMISDNAIDCLCEYPWPGNVRELENVIQQMVVMNNKECLDVSMVPRKISEGAKKPNQIMSKRGVTEMLENHKDDHDIVPMDILEKEAIENALKKLQGNVAKASNALNISQATMYRKLKEYNLVLDQYK